MPTQPRFPKRHERFVTGGRTVSWRTITQKRESQRRDAAVRTSVVHVHVPQLAVGVAQKDSDSLRGRRAQLSLVKVSASRTISARARDWHETESTRT